MNVPCAMGTLCVLPCARHLMMFCGASQTRPSWQQLTKCATSCSHWLILLPAERFDAGKVRSKCDRQSVVEVCSVDLLPLRETFYLSSLVVVLYWLGTYIQITNLTYQRCSVFTTPLAFPFFSFFFRLLHTCYGPTNFCRRSYRAVLVTTATGPARAKVLELGALKGLALEQLHVLRHETLFASMRITPVTERVIAKIRDCGLYKFLLSTPPISSTRVFVLELFIRRSSATPRFGPNLIGWQGSPDVSLPPCRWGFSGSYSAVPEGRGC